MFYFNQCVYTLWFYLSGSNIKRVQQISIITINVTWSSTSEIKIPLKDTNQIGVQRMTRAGRLLYVNENEKQLRKVMMPSKVMGKYRMDVILNAASHCNKG